MNGKRRQEKISVGDCANENSIDIKTIMKDDELVKEML